MEFEGDKCRYDESIMCDDSFWLAPECCEDCPIKKNYLKRTEAE